MRSHILTSKLYRCAIQPSPKGVILPTKPARLSTALEIPGMKRFTTEKSKTGVELCLSTWLFVTGQRSTGRCGSVIQSLHEPA